MIINCDHINCENSAMVKMDKLSKALRGNRPAIRNNYGISLFITMFDRWGWHSKGPEKIHITPTEYLINEDGPEKEYYRKCNRCLYAMTINASYHKKPNIHLLRKILSRTIKLKEGMNDYPKAFDITIQTIKEVIRVAIDSGNGGITQDQLEEFVQKTVDQAYYMGQ